tara:strand:- start:771 stop:998 length:228 start_codon:yes stop_codon:yes gene_type:complete
MIDYTNGTTVVVNHFGKNKVGTIAERMRTVKGYRYLIATEDGKTVEDVYVDDKDSTSYIDSRLTKSFNKHTENGN